MAENLYQYYLQDDPQGTKASADSLGSQTVGGEQMVSAGEQAPINTKNINSTEGPSGVSEAQVRNIVTDMLQNMTQTGRFAGTSATIPGYQLVSNNYLPAGERLLQGDAVTIINDYKQVSNNQDSNFGDVSGKTRYGLKFTPNTRVTAASIRTLMKKAGTPADNLTIEIQTDSSGSPSGTAITNGTSSNVAGSSATTEYGFITFSFSSAFTLEPLTTYWAVIKRSGAVDAANYYILRTYSTDYATFSSKTYDGAAWNAASALLYMDMTTSTGDQSLQLWKANSGTQAISSFAGFSSGNFLPGVVALISVSGIDNHQSGLTKGLVYYVSNVSGQITTSPGTYGSKVGFAISSTEIQMFGDIVATGSQAGFELKNDTSTTTDHVIITGFKPKIIQLNAGSATTGAGISIGYTISTSAYNCFYTNAGTGTSNNDSDVTSSYSAFIPDSTMAEFASATIPEFLDNGFVIRWKNGSATAGRFIVYNWIAQG